MAYGTETYLVTVTPESGKYLAKVVKRESDGYDPRENQTLYKNTSLAVALDASKEKALADVVKEAFGV